jgi:hypothetical protein
VPALLAAGTMLAVTGVTMFFAWWFGIRVRSEPDSAPSLGLTAATLQPPPAARRTIRARTVAPARPCADCEGRLRLIRSATDSGLRVDVVVNVHPTLLSCGDATVDLVVSGTPGFWKEHPALAKAPTAVALGWDRTTHLSSSDRGPALVSIHDDPQAPLHPAYYLDSDLQRDRAHPTTYYVRAGQRREPRGLGLTVHHWADSRRPIIYRFKADWVKPRAFGSCYVTLPSLPANAALGGQVDAVQTLVGGFDNTLLPRSQPPSFGRTALVTNGTLSLSDSTPAPNDSQSIFVGTRGSENARTGYTRAGPVWSCHPQLDLSYVADTQASSTPPESSFAGNACGALAVVDAPRADDLRGLITLALGAIFGLALAGLATSGKRAVVVLRDRRHAPTAQPPS